MAAVDPGPNVLTPNYIETEDPAVILKERDYYRELSRVYEDALAGRNSMPGVFSHAMQQIETMKKGRPQDYESKRVNYVNKIKVALADLTEYVNKLETL